MQTSSRNDPIQARWRTDLSLRGKAWIRPPLSDVGELPGVPPLALEVACRRGIADPASFFRPTLAATMPEPFTLPDMDRAVVSFCDALAAGRRIAVYGDYDVDGATSIALILRYLAALGVTASLHIPNRLSEGYGLSIAGIDRLADQGADCLLAVGSGTNATRELLHATSVGMVAVVLDHHDPGDGSPPAAVVNPKRSDKSRSYDYLCSVGIVFLFLVAINRELEQRHWFSDDGGKPDLRRFLGLVALGTVAAVVPLLGLNRAYVATGLTRLAEIPGLRALSKASGEEQMSVGNLGLVLGPCINAAGRIDDTSLGARLLITDNPDEASAVAVRLVEIYDEWQRMQKIVATAAVQAGTVSSVGALPVVVMDDPDWHPCIIGLTASRLRETFDRPAIAIGAGGKGSCCSVEGFDMGAAIVAARELGIVIAGEGHPMAAGFTIDPERIQSLADFVGARAAAAVRPPIAVDLAIEAGQLTPALAVDLEPLAPFGAGNPRPRIAVIGGVAVSMTEISGRHIKIALRGPAGETEAIVFDGVGTPFGEGLRRSKGRRMDLLGTVRVDNYGCLARAVLCPEDAMVW